MSIFDQLLIAIDDGEIATIDQLVSLFPGISRQQLASTLGRLVGRGWLQTREQAKETSYQVSPVGNSHINQILQMIRVSETPWSETWLWLVARLPEEKRRERDLLRLELQRQGFGRLVDGLYLHPRDPKNVVSESIKRLGLGSSVFIFENRAIGQGTNQILIQTSWNWPALTERLGTFLDDAMARLPQIARPPGEHQERYQQRLEAKYLVFEYGEILASDPNFPITLVPNKELYETGRRFYQEVRRYCYV